RRKMAPSGQATGVRAPLAIERLSGSHGAIKGGEMATGWETAWAIVFWVALVGIVYPYVGYAAVIWLIARFRQDPYLMSDRLPTVTVLVAAYNEEDVIARKILNSLALDYPKEKLEILVVTDGCTDETDAVIRRYEDQGVRLLSRSQRQGKVN